MERTVLFRSFSFRFHSAAASVWRGQEMFHTCLLSPSGGTKQGLVRAGSTEQRVRAWAGTRGRARGARGRRARAHCVCFTQGLHCALRSKHVRFSLGPDAWRPSTRRAQHAAVCSARQTVRLPCLVRADT